MHQQGFGLPAPAQFHRISHHFPHLFLTTSRKTIPLSMVCVFVAIGQHIGLQVSPVNYPRKVLAHIQHPQPTGAGIWVDVTGSLGRTVLDYQLDVVAGLIEGNENNPFPDIRSWISPASVPSMLIRSANNILSSFRMRGWDDDVNDDDHLIAGGLYGAGCIIALFDGRPDVLSRILNANHLFPLDDKAIFVDLILNVLPDGTLHKAEAAMAADLRINTRQTVFSRVSANIQFTVGMYLRHKRFGYSGIITGWDVS
jgi:F-box protein 21